MLLISTRVLKGSRDRHIDSSERAKTSLWRITATAKPSPLSTRHKQSAGERVSSARPALRALKAASDLFSLVLASKLCTWNSRKE